MTVVNSESESVPGTTCTWIGPVGAGGPGGSSGPPQATPAADAITPIANKAAAAHANFSRTRITFSFTR
jgi:hypothetical protein